MKLGILLLALLSVLNMCQDKNNPDLPITTSTDNENSLKNNAPTDFGNVKNNAIEGQVYDKGTQIASIRDFELQQTGVVSAKEFVVEDDFYELHYRYPYLEDEGYPKFNAYIYETYLNVEKVVNQILDDKELQCNDKGSGCDKDTKYLDFKIYSLQEELLSILLYEENYYAGVAHSSYKFDCLNFNLNTGRFIKFNDLFINDAAPFVFDKINSTIQKDLKSGEMYYECWPLITEDFEVYKDNFVLNEDHMRFYFDDCVICPSFTGTYYVEIPIEEVMPYFKIFKPIAQINYALKH